MTQLLSKLDLGRLILKNRVVLAPLTRGRADPLTHIPNDVQRVYYEQRASAGLIITEATSVSEQGHGWYGAPCCYNQEQSDAWRKIVDGVHAKGGVIFMQLWHLGRKGHSSFHENKDLVSASAIAVPVGTARNSNYEAVPFEVPRALSTEEVVGVVQDYKKASHFAKLAGFDGIEVHGANGYLVDQFLQSSTNIRTDKYGGSFDNRFRFLREIVEAISEVWPSDRIGVRISPNGGSSGMGNEDNYDLFRYVATELAKYNLAYLHVMDGLGYGCHTKCRYITLFDMKTCFKGPVMGNVCYTKEIAEGVIRSGCADLVAFGRPFISNPDLVERFTNNWPLAPEASYDHWWVPNQGSSGYSDYPAYIPPPVVSSEPAAVVA